MIRSGLLLLLIAATWAVDADAKLRADYDARLAQVAAEQYDRRVELARWARGKGLASEADALLEAVLTAQPEHPAARKALGYEKIGSAWLRGEPLWQAKKWVRYLGRWMPPAERKRMIAQRDSMRQQLKARAGWDKAWEAKTAHFAVKSNCQVRVVEDILVAMEQYYTVASRMFLLGNTQARIPVEVYANRDEFAKASANDRIAAGENTLGYYVSGKDLIRTYFAGSLDQTQGVLFHETTHLIVNRFAKRDVPTWTNEGLAVFFEDAQRLEDRVDPDAIPWTRLWSLRDMLAKGPVPLKDTVDCAQGAYNVDYYPRGWGLTNFLMHVHRKPYETYLMLLKKGGTQSNSELFVKGIGKQPADLQAAWEAYIKAIEPKTADELANAAVAALGTYLDPQRAEDYAQRSVDLAAGSWRSQAALGAAKLAIARLSGRRESAVAAVAAFDTACELAKADPVSIKARVKKGQSLSIWTDLLASRMFACFEAGDGERAAACACELLEVDEASAYAYGMLAVLGAGDPEDGAEAATFLATAQDIGNDHLVRWCAARVAAATGRLSEAANLLAEAAKLDRLGLGRAWYPAEAKRLATPKR